MHIIKAKLDYIVLFAKCKKRKLKIYDSNRIPIALVLLRTKKKKKV